ncbi:MAG: UDP-N-acetylglucosamine 1-carboxyvinyltransferase [Candidatus Colwellbacteria bacterium]|nr:UDP-N-acetylglucosamine 1-carboxyvinyltransferase [Candidatus Colwellbacteria bacterium]
MEKLVIKGGIPLKGSVRVKGAKNAIGKMMMASLLTDEEVVLKNVPRNQETEIAIEIVESVGSEVRREGDSIITRAEKIRSQKVAAISRKNRIPILALGPLLARVGEGEVPFSGATAQPNSAMEMTAAVSKAGGDKIGARPVDFHIAALEKLGAEIEIKDGSMLAKTKGLTGATITLPYPSVGATENTLLASVLAKGRTVIQGAATEPEIIDLVKMLQKMGAIIEFGANREIFIEGVDKLHGVEHTLIPDRMEAASFAIMALATGGDVFVEGAVQEHLITFLNVVRRIGGEYEVSDDGIRFFRNGRLKAVHVETDTHPGFMTDWQQPLTVLLTQAKGNSIIHETVYENRFGYTEDLVKMGADIEVLSKCLGDIPCRFQGKMYNHSAIIHGPTPLRGRKLEMRDIRAGMAHIIAALISNGSSEISGVEHIDRGYEDIDGRIRTLGADIKRISED